MDTMETNRKICQCCGMPITEDLFGRNADGTPNDKYCKWCLADGVFTYHDIDALIEVCVKHMVNENYSEGQLREYMKNLLPTLEYWKNFSHLNTGEYQVLKEELVDEINALAVKGLPRVKTLTPLVGKYVNLAYPLPSGESVKFLEDDSTYLGAELEPESGVDRRFGVVANNEFILVVSYEKDLSDPRLLLYKKR